MNATLEIDGELEDVVEHFSAQGWTDGLPIIPPTRERVERFLRYTDRDPDDVVGVLAPSKAEATVHAVAVNAVMAGCRPAYLPVVLAAVAAAAEPTFNLSSLQATTNPVATLVMVNGPIARELDVNARGNCLGPGWPANATVGRALRLCLLNIGGGIPQDMDKATHGQPGKYTMCIAENTDDSPWPSFAADLGYDADVSTVTTFGVTGTQNTIEMAAKDGIGILRSLASALCHIGMQNVQLGGGPLVVACPEHAGMIAAAGFSKADAKRFLYENARVPVRDFPRDTLVDVVRHRRGRWFGSDHPDATIPVADAPELIEIVVAGGPGPHSLLMPSFGEATQPSTTPIALRDGTPVRSVEDFVTR